MTRKLIACAALFSIFAAGAFAYGQDYPARDYLCRQTKKHDRKMLEQKLSSNTVLNQQEKKELIDVFDQQYAQNAAGRGCYPEDIAFLEKIAGGTSMNQQQRVTELNKYFTAKWEERDISRRDTSKKP